MKLSTRYISFIVLIHGIAILMSYYIFKENKVLFIASELGVIISLYLSHSLYLALVQPIQLINKSIDAINEKDFSTKFQQVDQKEMDSLIGVYNKMIDRLRTERTEKTQKHYFLEKLIMNSPIGIVLLNLEHEISMCNPKALEYIGLPLHEIQKCSLEGTNHPLLEKFASLNSGETQIVGINGAKTYKCHKAHFIDRNVSNYFIVIEELTQEKLEIEKQTYSKIIRMMAHEVNNSIGPINSILHSLVNYYPQISEQDQEDYTDIIQVAIDRNDKLNGFMHNFAKVVRLPQPLLDEVDFCKILKEISSFMLTEAQERNIEILLDLPESSFWVHIDIKQIEQVLINVIKNAMESIGCEGGEIEIVFCEKNMTLSIYDSGKGISHDLAEKAFAPFYSSKKNGQGIGLTLSKEILTNHGFDFALKPRATKGAVFEINFMAKSFLPT